jgi:hypothetical protein
MDSTDYSPTTNHWEPWQRTYQFGTLLIFPPEPLRTTINQLRAIHDPYSQAICDAHISLTRPLPRAMTEADWVECQALVADFAPVLVQYGPLRHYLPHPGVCLRIEPQAELEALLQRLESAQIFREAPPRAYPFSAHMTIAEFISAEHTLALMQSLAMIVPNGTFRCTTIAYAVPDTMFHLTERRQISL